LIKLFVALAKACVGRGGTVLENRLHRHNTDRMADRDIIVFGVLGLLDLVVLAVLLLSSPTKNLRKEEQGCLTAFLCAYLLIQVVALALFAVTRAL
jgi:hypothetical protein